MKGQRSLFADIILPEKPTHKPTQGSSTRNEKLLHRYYWYAQLQPQRLDYAYIIGQLCIEFDLSDFRLIVVMQNNHQRLKEIIATKPTTKDLQKLYPYLSWH